MESLGRPLEDSQGSDYKGVQSSFLDDTAPKINKPE